ncbi:(2Fe-2S)-binding protein [Paenibacillus sp. MWE-103]|uniref:(2Fe-2S)-binding protein n=1 Tax=Paenibacillus artemisiicola TaxID=1172618 RepID=A0ABS3WGA0_9BACL|nr:(2Fe-2S)-binding protein [Paenibacillus artemisiicola]MBO7747322.1 (2Fe-2S)-binding protein [Paenibacillus artemisiicola]
MSDRGIVKGEMELLVNGRRRPVVVRSADTLLRVLREHLGLTGAKAGCENGDCGACTVMLNGLAVKSCLVLAIETHGMRITTIEGLEDAPIQQAFIDKFAFQCGFCTSGFIMNCQALLERFPDADEAVVTEWLRSNICRCTSYQEIREAIHAVLDRE